RRGVEGRIAQARKALSDRRLDDEGVHDARKDLKRARSGLHLLRPFDEMGYQRENQRLRNAARRLADVRDHKVLLRHIAELLAKEKNPAWRRLFLALRKELYNARRRDWRKLRSRKELQRIDATLADVAQRVRQWRIPAAARGQEADAPQLALQRLY